MSLQEGERGYTIKHKSIHLHANLGQNLKIQPVKRKACDIKVEKERKRERERGCFCLSLHGQNLARGYVYYIK